LAALLQQREEILKRAQKFFRRRAFVEHLESHAPELLAWATWRVIALELAERREVEVQPSSAPQPSPPPRQKLTPEEREAKVEQYRARMLERERVQAHDYMARVKQKIDLRNQFRADLEHSGLDPDEVQMLEQEFLEKLFNEEDHPYDTASKEVI
jgi:hypothetical protein